MSAITGIAAVNRRRFLRTAGITVAAAVPMASAYKFRTSLPDEGPIPDLSGAVGWLNTAPLNSKSLRRKVVFADFWTYTCINSLRPLPYVKSWAEKYRDAGLVVIGVHTPEFSFEKQRVNVENALRDLKVTFPVAIDSDYRIWQAFNNEYWPAQYLIDGKGRIRFHHFGEGQYDEFELVIQQLLKENGAAGLDGTTVRVTGNGVEAAPGANQLSPETYVGYRRAERFSSRRDSRKIYNSPAKLAFNKWGLSGDWNVGAESAVLQAAPGKILFRFHSRDLHMVLGPKKDGAPVGFKVKLDGSEPNGDCGVDSAADGAGTVKEPRLYQLVRQKSDVRDRTFEIEFLDPGVQAFAFTFG